MRWSLAACVLAASPLLLASPILGQSAVEPPCPPGRICEPVPAREPPPGAALPGAVPGARPPSADAARTPPAEELATPAAPAASRAERRPESAAPPAPVPEQPAAEPLAPDASIHLAAPPPPPPVPPARRRWRRQLGVATHLDWALLGSAGSEAAAMAGLGAAFRYRPLRGVALDTGLDLVGGRDWEGNRRREYQFSASTLLYFNPTDMAQVYLLTGLTLARARVTTGLEDAEFGDRANPKYSYFGGHLGLGLEWCLRDRLALNLDLTGFLRGRTDAAAERVPEFVHGDTGVGTNTSGGGLLRGGVTFYF